MKQRISVVIPVYNGALYLSECIASVCAQTLAVDEIIVVDDGSGDDTPRVAAEWGTQIRYHGVAHGGLPYARNQGLRLVDSEVIAFIDSDDIWLPDKLEKQMAMLMGHDEPVMVFGHMQQFVSGDLTPDEAAQIKIETEILAGPAASTLLIRKRDCERIGPFDESLRIGEFIEWYSRATDAGVKTLTVSEIVCRRRLHRNNMGRGGAATHAGYLPMLKKVLDRRREQS